MSADPAVSPGTVLAGKYRVEHVLRSGGMGTVLVATQIDLDRKVALKFMLPERSDDGVVAFLRFEREARVVARLRGEHVVQVYDFGKLAQGEPYIVMELLDGQDLKALIHERERVPIPEAVGYVLEACEGLAEAHAAGIVHRDLKPANLFLTRKPNGRVKLKILDFGIAKLTEGSGDDIVLTSTRGQVGSPLYMSPEQLQSPKAVDHRADVWALGTVLYELLTGTAPFMADAVPLVYAKILTADPPPLGEFLPGAPAQLEITLRRSLAKRPEDRFPTIADLAAALAPFAPRSALSCVAASIRTLRGSSLDRGQLPELPNESMPPPALEQSSPTERSGSAVAASNEATVLDIAPTKLGGPAKVYRSIEIDNTLPATASTGSRVAPKRSGVVLGVAGIAVVAAAGLAFWLGGRDGVTPAAHEIAIASTPLASPAPASSEVASPPPVVSEVVIVTPSASAAPSAAPAPPVVKTARANSRPKPAAAASAPATPSMLQHRK